jgi:NAD+ kinase
MVVHPTRGIESPLAAVMDWAAQRDVEVVQLEGGDHDRVVAPSGDVDSCDLIVAIGGDGTVLTALRAAALTSTPVLGVAWGSLGALSAVKADELPRALDMFDSGEWTPRHIPALNVTVDGRPAAWAINDLVLVRRGVGQLIVDVTVADELYARLAGDGVVVATGLGSSAYSMAAGGPIVVTGTNAFVVTPLVIHGGCAPPLVVDSGLEVKLEAHPSFGGFDVEVDGHVEQVDGAQFSVRLTEAKATLVAVGDTGLGLTALRQRGLIVDSPRVLARDARVEREERDRLQSAPGRITPE